MNILIPVAAIAAIAYSLSSSKKPKKSTGKISAYLSEDCNWLCADVVLGFDPAKEFIQHSKTMEKAVAKLGNNVTIVSLAKEVFNTYLSKTKCKLKYEDVTLVDSLTVRYIWSTHLVSAALYLATSNKITDLQAAEWLYTEYPKELVSLGLMIIGSYHPDIMKQRFSLLTDDNINSFISTQFTLYPSLRNMSAELIATIFMMALSQVMTVEKQGSCIKVINLFYADYTSLAGQSDPMFKSQFERIFKAVITLNPKS